MGERDGYDHDSGLPGLEGFICSFTTGKGGYDMNVVWGFRRVWESGVWGCVIFLPTAIYSLGR
jgi:hypothetical protein